MENNSQAIELKGIVRNQTKIGVQDGQCDDIVNLRFKDGSWRVADDGKVMLDADNGTPFNVSDYSQLYVHTNVYHHLLGVKQGKLYWFANIDADGESFTFVKNTNSVPSPVEICDVQGDVTIVQNGHLLTIISTATTDTTPLPLADSSESMIKYAIFKTGTNEYKVINVNANGEQTDRGMYPFGEIHLNLDCAAKTFTHENQEAGKIICDSVDIDYQKSGALIPKEDESTTHAASQIWHSSMLDVFKQAKDENYFANPFLAIVAVRMYDDSYLYTSAPVLLNPRERYNDYTQYYDSENNTGVKSDSCNYQYHTCLFDEDNSTINKIYVKYKDSVWIGENGSANAITKDIARYPIFYSGASGHFNNPVSYYEWLTSKLKAAQICLSLGDISQILDNPDIFKGISIFVTKEANLYDLSEEGYKKGKVYSFSRKKIGYGESIYCVVGNACYRPYLRKKEEIMYDLVNSPFYLLKDYSLQELTIYNKTSFIVDLSAPEDKGLLNSLTSQTPLESIALNRKDYIPKVVYSYNQKLHIANYKSFNFRGYPIDWFHLNNHNVKVQEGSYAISGMLPNLINGDEVQHKRDKFYFAQTSDAHHDNDTVNSYINNAKSLGTCFAAITTTIETSQGEQKVVRFIAPYNSNYTNAGEIEKPATFIEDLGALLAYPDYRAKEMMVEIIRLRENEVTKYYKKFQLKSHRYLNIAYYMNDELKPIRIYDFEKKSEPLDNFMAGDVAKFLTPLEQNEPEEFPNGLKVSKVNNPFTFPDNSTYQVGSSEIVALMSNAVAVGTGQTGAAPLYVFCKDGIYALLVDSTGEMTYTNARIIARDVCNNTKSVTPIDDGVVFTTDRGIMSIAGSEVVEIGSAVEGDVFDITDNGNLPNKPIMADKAKKIMFNAFTMQQLAEFPQSLIDNTDFLTYLKGAIINYNHNERELMVSDPDKEYTYVMDRNGNWSRRAFTAQEYVNNYPTSYRIDKAGNFYKVDADDNDTNKVYLLSNVIKLGTIAFKQAYRLVVRGYFETTAYPSAFGYINEKLVRVEGSFIDRMEKGEELKMSYITKYGQSLWVNINDDSILSGGITIYDQLTNEDVTETIVSVDNGSYYTIQRTENNSTIGCYVFSSSSGNKWKLVGGNEKSGKFSDIGCKVSHEDIRFLRVCLAGKLTKDSRIDYIEVSADGSALNGKLR